jgi:hypothetical protein
MAVTTMSEMWARLDAYNLNAEGEERPVNQVNEWGGFSRKLGMPVFTAWFDHVGYDKENKTTKVIISDSTWQGTVGVNNQERWIKFAEERNNSTAAFFVIHAANENAHPRKVKYIDDDKVFIGQLVRNGTETYIVGQPRLLRTT